MNDFKYIDGRLHCGGVPVEKIAAEVGTPFYLYSHATLARHFRVFAEGFAPIPHIIAFAVKANSSIAVLSVLGGLGAGADVVSGGELFRAQKAAIPAGKTVYSGVGKTADEMERALRAGILMFNVESSEEMAALSENAGRLGMKAPIALRINPDIDPRTHKYISTGLKENKFGIDISLARDGYAKAAALANIQIVGVACHIGSQLTELGPFKDALDRLLILIRDLRADGHDIRYLDIGGGLGITYQAESPPQPGEYARMVRETIADMNLTLVLEPGRVIVGNAGILVTRLLYRKRQAGKRFLIVDAGMNDLIRPSLYGSWHEILPVRENNGPRSAADVVGPICESGDFFARARELPELAQGELLAVMSAGAYGFSMSSNYNSRPRCAEVMVKDDRHHVIRGRESLDDLIALETIPDL